MQSCLHYDRQTGETLPRLTRHTARRHDTWKRAVRSARTANVTHARYGERKGTPTMNTPIKPACEEAIIRSRDAAPLARFNPTWTLVATILGSSLSFIDGTVVNVALPSIQREFHASGADAQWVVESYALLLCALILVGGSLGDRYGRKRIYIIGITIFTLASVACGFAPNILALISARAVQGIGGGGRAPRRRWERNAPRGE